MKKLCFGTIFNILSHAFRGTKKELYIEIEHIVGFDTIAYADQSVVTRRAKGDEEFPNDITTKYLKTDASIISMGFQKNIINRFYADRRELIVLAIKDILDKDYSIPDTRIVGIDSSYTKENILSSETFFLPDLLTNVFLYAIQVENKPCKQNIKEVVDKDYLLSFEEMQDSIILLEEFSGDESVIKKTINDTKFDETFKQIPTSLSLSLTNPSLLRFYQLNIQNKSFSLEEISKFIRLNIARYVFSREEYQQLIVESPDTVGLEALTKLNNTVPDEQKVKNFSEVMVYSFLESALKAPKLMSSVELQADWTIKSKSSSIHLLTSPFTNTKLIFGAANTTSSLIEGLDNVFAQIKQIISNISDEIHLINKNIMSQAFDRSTRKYLIDNIIPNKMKRINTEHAFGIFIGYSVETVDKKSYSNEKYPEYLMNCIEKDILNSLNKIIEKIEEYDLNDYSFFFYILPLDNAENNAKEIMKKSSSVGGM